MKKFIGVLFLLCLTVPAMADWVPVSYCDGGLLEIDVDSAHNTVYQIVLRGNVVNWIVNQTGLIAPSRINSSGEVIQTYVSSPGFGAYRSVQINNGRNNETDALSSLENFPPRFQSRSYSPKYGTQGPLQTYNFQNCKM